MYQSGSPESLLWGNDSVRSGRSTPDTDTIEYKVRANECLSEIVRKLTGSTNWKSVYELNKDTIGSNPNYLDEGMVLLIPAAVVEDEEDDS